MGDALTSEWLPAWVQAVGTIAAIAGAAAIVLLQHNLEQRARSRREMTERIFHVRALVAFLLALQGKLQIEAEAIANLDASKALEVEVAFGSAGRDLQGYGALLRDFDLTRFDNPNIWMAFAGLVAAVESQTSRLLRWEKMLRDAEDPAPESFAPFIPQVLTGFELLQKRLAHLVGHLNGTIDSVVRAMT